MKRFVLMVLSSVVVLSAVKWQEEQVTSSTDSNSYMPILALDSDGKPSIVFTRGPTQGPYKLDVISEAEPEWITSEIAEIPEGSMVYFSADFSPENHMFVAFSTRFDSQFDLYLASDTSGSFETTNLTDDAFNQYLPIVKVGTDDVVRMVYKEENDSGYNIRYGWLDAGIFDSESIKDTMLMNPFDFDFILDKDNNPHVFFTGDDYMLYHATRIAANNWSIVNLGVLGRQPSAALGSSGVFSLVYTNLGKLWILSNPGGVWSTEDVTSAPLMYNYDYPVIALDNGDNPHLFWHRWEPPFLSYPDFMNEVFYSGKTIGVWSEPDSMPPLGNGKSFGSVHPFRTDKNGFGHVAYMVWLETRSQIFYAKTSQPFTSGITENHSEFNSPSLSIDENVVRFSIPQSSFIRLTLFDASGRMVKELASGTYPAGQNEIGVNSSALPAGVYFARLESNDASVNARMVLIK